MYFILIWLYIIFLLRSFFNKVDSVISFIIWAGKKTWLNKTINSLQVHKTPKLTSVFLVAAFNLNGKYTATRKSINIAIIRMKYLCSSFLSTTEMLSRIFISILCFSTLGVLITFPVFASTCSFLLQHVCLLGINDVVLLYWMKNIATILSRAHLNFITLNHGWTDNEMKLWLHL